MRFLAMLCILLAQTYAKDLQAETSCEARLTVVECGKRGSSQRKRYESFGTPSFSKKVIEQLDSLPYEYYQILESYVERLSESQTAAFRILNARHQSNTLTLTLHDVVKDRIHITVTWVDEMGKEILAAELRVHDADPVVVGTDNETSRDDAKCTVLWLELNC